MRWTQFGAFSPLMRPHGKAPRDPWYFGEAAVANYQFWAWVRESLLDYIYHAAVVAHESGIPMIRSMPVAFPHEQPLADLRDQYMFGEDLLITPVIDERGSRTIAFPSGQWTDLLNGKTFAGPANTEVNLPFDKIGVYLRPGAAVPVQLNLEFQFGKSMSKGCVNALVVTPPKGAETTQRRNAKGQTAEVSVRTDGNAFVWTIEDLLETDHLLVYGIIAPAAVLVDGKVVPTRTTSPVGSLTYWEDEPGGNRLIIHLPSRQARSNVVTVRIET